MEQCLAEGDRGRATAAAQLLTGWMMKIADIIHAVNIISGL